MHYDPSTCTGGAGDGLGGGKCCGGGDIGGGWMEDAEE